MKMKTIEELEKAITEKESLKDRVRARYALALAMYQYEKGLKPKREYSDAKNEAIQKVKSAHVGFHALVEYEKLLTDMELFPNHENPILTANHEYHTDIKKLVENYYESLI